MFRDHVHLSDPATTDPEIRLDMEADRGGSIGLHDVSAVLIFNVPLATHEACSAFEPASLGT